MTKIMKNVPGCKEIKEISQRDKRFLLSTQNIYVFDKKLGKISFFGVYINICLIQTTVI